MDERQRGSREEAQGTVEARGRRRVGIAVGAMLAATTLVALASAALGVGPAGVAAQVTASSISQLVQHPDGTYRRLYSLGSPESWFEDFGSGQLRGGQATVRLDPDFAALVRTDAYHVFLTPEGSSNGLYVAGKSSTSFEVREQSGGRSSIPFSYRVVARRRDALAPRLEQVELPPTPVPPPTMAPPPAPPPLPPPPPLPLRPGVGPDAADQP